MTSTDFSPLRDHELIKMLAQEPELFAVADALFATQTSDRQAPRRWKRATARFGVAIAGVAAVAALVLSIPWHNGGSFEQEALAAIGDDPVLHVVTTQPSRQGYKVVNIADGNALPQTLTTEIWFDNARSLKKTISRINGSVIGETLETKQGGYSESGPIYTCAWIADHPIEAAELRVTCDPNGKVGSGERHVAESTPGVDQALIGFVDSYRSALKSGKARKVGHGELDGHRVVWLQFSAARTDGSSGEISERVAVDEATHKPLLVEQWGGAVRFQVATIETIPFQAKLFDRPQQIELPVAGSVSSQSDISQSEAVNALGGKGVWLGREWNGLRLVAVKRDNLTIGYSRLSTREPAHPAGVELVYESVSAHQLQIVLREAATCSFAYGWSCTARDPQVEGTVAFNGAISLARVGGLFVAIWIRNGNGEAAGLEVARALVPLPTG